jgi:hypothetical protein
MEFKYCLYFLIGGTIVSLATYFAGHGKPLIAAFFAAMPAITIISFLTIYHEVGEKAIVPYAKGLIIMMLPWMAYIFSIILLTSRVGFFPSLATGYALYVAAAFVIMKTL